ncbi:SAM-dependent methyltransferase [Streptomyces lavendulae]|uniref:SAM-dependent methyltransferase n=1 Tax=Streptomyces lavendulae TaxID=1914 RepID=UPI00255671AE|nr:class I SAM-dependent methyltransferase [Streptomyces lavendulae]
MLSPAEFTELVHTPTSRRDRYSEMLPAFYAIATDPYRGNWAESFHLPPFEGNEPLERALAEQEHRLARVAGLRAGKRVLDVGCGVGGPAISIAEYSGAHVTGVNIVPRHVEIATAKAASRGLQYVTDFRVADMMDLPFDEATFDAAFSFDAICHAPDKNTVYAQIARVLKPGGIFIGADWLCADDLTPDDYQQWIEPVCKYAALPSVLSLRQVVDGFTGAGFVVDDYCDLASRGDMSPNWRLFEHAAATIEAPRTPEKEFMYQHCLTTARAGQAGKLVIGYWCARRPG